jgi:hypothetical protein
VSITSTSIASAVLTVSTGAATRGQGSPISSPPRLHPPGQSLILLLGISGVLLVLTATRRRHIAWLAISSLLVAALFASCGGGGGNAGVGASPPSTPAENYSIQVNAISGTDSHSITINVKVQ